MFVFNDKEQNVLVNSWDCLVGNISFFARIHGHQGFVPPRIQEWIYEIVSSVL